MILLSRRFCLEKTKFNRINRPPGWLNRPPSNRTSPVVMNHRFAWSELGVCQTAIFRDQIVAIAATAPIRANQWAAAESLVAVQEHRFNFASGIVPHTNFSDRENLAFGINRVSFLNSESLSATIARATATLCRLWIVRVGYPYCRWSRISITSSGKLGRQRVRVTKRE